MKQQKIIWLLLSYFSCLRSRLYNILNGSESISNGIGYSQVGNINGPALYKSRIPEKPQEHNEKEQNAHARFVPWDRSKFLVFFLDNRHRNSFAFLPDIYCASILAFRSKETHVHHLQPQPYENTHQQHGRYRIEHPGSKVYARAVREASESK